MRDRRTISRDRSPLADIITSGSYAYVDKIDVWLKKKLSPKDYQALQDNCRGRIRPTYGPSRFSKEFCVRLCLSQPTPAALNILATLNDLKMTAVEISLDLIVQSDLELAREAIDKHFVKRNHATDVIYFRSTRYTGPRWRSKTVIAIYDDKPSKVTGELNCVHIDWRMFGSETLKRAGLGSPRELLELCFHHFWESRLLFFAPDHAAFGRKYWNWQLNSRRRLPWISEFPTRNDVFRYDNDKRISHSIFRSCDSMQIVWDVYGKHWDGIRPYVNQIIVDDLLPKNSH